MIKQFAITCHIFGTTPHTCIEMNMEEKSKINQRYLLMQNKSVTRKKSFLSQDPFMKIESWWDTRNTSHKCPSVAKSKWSSIASEYRRVGEWKLPAQLWNTRGQHISEWIHDFHRGLVQSIGSPLHWQSTWPVTTAAWSCSMMISHDAFNNDKDKSARLN